MLYRINNVMPIAMPTGEILAVIYGVSVLDQNEVRHFMLTRQAHGTDEDAVDMELHTQLGLAKTFDQILLLDQHADLLQRKARADASVESARARRPEDGFFYHLAFYAPPESEDGKAQIWVELEDGNYRFIQRPRSGGVAMLARTACHDLAVRFGLAMAMNELTDLAGVQALNAA